MDGSVLPASADQPAAHLIAEADARLRSAEADAISAREQLQALQQAKAWCRSAVDAFGPLFSTLDAEGSLTRQLRDHEQRLQVSQAVVIQLSEHITQAQDAPTPNQAQAELHVQSDGVEDVQVQFRAAQKRLATDIELRGKTDADLTAARAAIVSATQLQQQADTCAAWALRHCQWLQRTSQGKAAIKEEERLVQRMADAALVRLFLPRLVSATS